PGLRGMIGIVLTAFAVMFERVGGVVRRPIDAFRAMPPRVRSLTLIFTSLTILILAGMFLGNQAASYVREARRPVLDDQIPIPRNSRQGPLPLRDDPASIVVHEHFGTSRPRALYLVPRAITKASVVSCTSTQTGEDPLVVPDPTPAATVDPN